MLQKTFDNASVLLSTAKRIACLTGAGVSAESGIATFREALTGLWSRFDPIKLASQEGFAEDPGMVWQWYMRRLAGVEAAQPNPAHLALARLQARTPDFTLITQNVDDLHERAGSQPVLHLHGSIAKMRCNRCYAAHALQPSERSAEQPPVCLHCGGLVRPAVVWFGEMLPAGLFEQARRAAQRCDLMLVVGTSGLVYPAAELPRLAYQSGAHLIEINPETTPLSPIATVFLAGKAGEVLPKIIHN